MQTTSCCSDVDKRVGRTRVSKSPLAWVGGKFHLAPKIVQLLPPHVTYVEPFGGAAHVLFAKQPSLVEVYNDMDSNLVNFFRVLRDPDKCAELQRRLQLTPYSREEFYYAGEHHDDENLDDVERARLFFVAVHQSFAARRGQSWGFSLTSHTGKYGAKIVHDYVNAVNNLLAAARRFQYVQVEHDDYREVMTRYATPDTVCYCDPPYHPETRKGKYYRHEFSHDDHVQFVEFLLQYPAMVVLSGYDHPLYHRLDDAGWQRFTFHAQAHSAGRTRGTGLLGAGATDERHRRTEVVWLNPQAWERLQRHQSGLLGDAGVSVQGKGVK